MENKDAFAFVPQEGDSLPVSRSEFSIRENRIMSILLEMKSDIMFIKKELSKNIHKTGEEIEDEFKWQEKIRTMKETLDKKVAEQLNGKK